MTPVAVAELVAALFVAAARDYGDAERTVYAKALARVDDAVGLQAMDELLPHVSWERPPSPGMVLQQVNAIHRGQREKTPAIEETTGPPATREVALEWVERIKAEHGPSGMTDALEKIAERQPPEEP